MSRLQCDFCAHKCLIEEGKTGRCGVRENRNNRLVSIYYGRLVSLAIDPMEKKPLYHFLPGTQTLSLAQPGCNFSCTFCQNYTISQKEFFSMSDTDPATPQEIAALLQKKKLPSVSYTYSEPVVWQDFMLDTAQLVKQAGGRNIMVTNGYFKEEALLRFDGLIDAYNIDLKGDAAFYKNYCGASIEPVVCSIASLAQKKEVVLEVTTLLIEGLHTLEMVGAMAKMLSDAGVQVWHLSRFHPAYKMRGRVATSEAFLAKAYTVASENKAIPYIYTGNSMREIGRDTYCPQCNALFIKRELPFGVSSMPESGVCVQCGYCHYGCYKN